jgi:multidrug efflux system outer membrane protein
MAVLPEIQAERIRVAGGQDQGEWPGSRWWRRYGDDQLDALISRALQDAPAMLVARQRVKTSEAVAKRADAATGPYVGMVGSVDRQEVSGSGFYYPFYGEMMGPKFAGPYYTEGTIGLEGGYTFDLWGKDKAQVQAALGLHRAEQAEMAETGLMLSTRIAQAYFQYQAVQATLTVLLQTRALLQERSEGYHAQLERGLVERSATDLAQARLLDLDGQIQDVRQRGLQLREQLRCLVGAGADDFPELRAVPLPEVAGGPLPALGYELLARRPDLQAMHWYVQASLSQVEVAKASFYPAFDLKAFFGYDALHTGDLMKSQSRQMNLVPGFSLPIFDSGRLNANLAQTRSRSNATIASYNQAVVDAVRQVAECGIELEGLGRQVRLQGAELEAHQSALASLQAKRTRGLVDRVALAEGGLPVQSELAKRIQLRQRQVLAEVSLIRALGGGYRADPSLKGKA